MNPTESAHDHTSNDLERILRLLDDYREYHAESQRAAASRGQFSRAIQHSCLLGAADRAAQVLRATLPQWLAWSVR